MATLLIDGLTNARIGQIVSGQGEKLAYPITGPIVSVRDHGSGGRIGVAYARLRDTTDQTLIAIEYGDPAVFTLREDVLIQPSNQSDPGGGGGGDPGERLI